MKLKFITRTDILNMDKNKDVFVFGAGSFGRETAKFLKMNGINFQGYCIDDAYYKKNKFSGGVISVSELSKRSEDMYELFYAVGNVDRLKCFLGETWREQAFVIWDPWITFEKDKDHIGVLADEFEKTLELWSDELSCRTQKGFLQALRTGVGYEDMENLQPGTYFNDLTEGLKFMEGGFVDCGAYDGDSVREYLLFAGNKKQKIWAFEPDMDNFKKLREYFSDDENVQCIPKGVWNSETRLHFSSDSEETSAIDENGEDYVDVTTIDGIVGNEKVACIKMDIEGSELNALKGAANVICRDYPMLLISAYHRVDDLITLPQYIRSIDVKGRYKFYLRHHACTRPELVFYAIPN